MIRLSYIRIAGGAGFVGAALCIPRARTAIYNIYLSAN
jgi:hypothetical protein